MIFGNYNMMNMFNMGTGCSFMNGYYDPTTLFTGNSIFGCGGNIDYEAMGAYNGAMMGMSVLCAALGSALSDSKTDSIDNREDAIDDLDAQIETELDKLPGCDIDDYQTYVVTKEDWYVDGMKEISDSRTEQQAIVDEFNQADYDEAKRNLDKAEKDLSEAIANDPSADYTGLKKVRDNFKTLFEEQDKLKKAKEAAEKELKKLDEKKEELKEKAKTEQDKADLIIENIDRLVAKRDKAVEELEAKIFKKAKGLTKYGRNRDLVVNDLENDNFKDEDIRELIARFPKLTDGSPEKWDCAKKLASLDETMYAKMATSTQIKARKIAIQYIKDNPNRPKTQSAS